jgi:EamA domain-containing membrane protein RarD
LVTGIPFVIWQIVLYRWLGEFGIGSGGAKATPFEIIPFLGVLKIATEGSVAAFLVLGVLLVIPAAVLPTVWALRETVRDLRQRKWELYSCLLLANAAVMPFVPFSTYREPLGLLRFIPGLVVMVVLYAAHFKRRRPLLYSTLWIPLILFVVSS